MPRVVPSGYLVARRLLRKTTAVLELLEVELTAGTVARLANNPAHVTAGGELWQASSFRIDGVGEDAEGTLPRFSVTLSNIGREPSAQLESGAVIGRRVTFYLVSEADLTTLPEGLAWSYTVLSASATRATATFECGLPSRLLSVPGMRYTLDRFPGILRRPPR